MREINIKSIIALFVIYGLIVGGYGISQLTKPKSTQQQPVTQQPANQELYADEMNTANAYLLVGDHEKATEHYKKAAETNDNDPETLFKVACSQYNAKQYEDSEKTFKKIESWGQTRSDYWLIRTENMSNILTSIKNINKAKKYSQNMDNFVTDKEGSWLYLTTKAKIYLSEYKYYRIKRKSYEQAFQEEIAAKETFLATLKDLEEISLKRNDSHIMRIRDDLLYQYRTFPDLKYESKFDNAPELEKMPYTQEDIERFKKHRPQDDFPSK